MILVGLTGSIGMGKSETAKMFRELGVPVYDADAAVHRLYEPGGAAVEPLEKAFPGVKNDGGIDRQALSKHVIGNEQAMKKLESIVHPLVGQEQLRFLKKAEADGAAMVVLDIPLLYETGGENRVDVVVVCSAPYEVQRRRTLEREGMTAEKFDAIVAKQVADTEKRRRADFIVETDKGLDDAMEQVKRIIPEIEKMEGKVWPTLKERLEQAAADAGEAR